MSDPGAKAMPIRPCSELGVSMTSLRMSRNGAGKLAVVLDELHEARALEDVEAVLVARRGAGAGGLDERPLDRDQGEVGRTARGHRNQQQECREERDPHCVETPKPAAPNAPANPHAIHGRPASRVWSRRSTAVRRIRCRLRIPPPSRVSSSSLAEGGRRVG